MCRNWFMRENFTWPGRLRLSDYNKQKIEPPSEFLCKCLGVCVIEMSWQKLGSQRPVWWLVDPLSRSDQPDHQVTSTSLRMVSDQPMGSDCLEPSAKDLCLWSLYCLFAWQLSSIACNVIRRSRANSQRLVQLHRLLWTVNLWFSSICPVGV